MQVSDLPDNYQRALKGIKFKDIPLGEVHKKDMAPWEQRGRVHNPYEFPDHQPCDLGNSIANALMAGPHRTLDGLKVHVRATTTVKDPAKTFRLSYAHVIPPPVREMAGFGLVIDVHAQTWQNHFDNEEWGYLVRMVDYSFCLLNPRGMLEQQKSTEPPSFLETWGPVSPHSQKVAKASIEGTTRMQEAEDEATEETDTPKEKSGNLKVA